MSAISPFRIASDEESDFSGHILSRAVGSSLAQTLAPALAVLT